MGKRNKEIKMVKNNIEKHKTYVELNNRCEKALENNDYESIILLTYAMIEDRLLSFLHYMYVIDRYGKKMQPTDNIDKIIRPLLKYKPTANKGSVYKIYNITTKIKILKLFSKQYDSEQYLSDCYNIIEKNIEISNYVNYFKELEKWIKIRNEIIHASYNKDIVDLNDKVETCAVKGMKLAKLIDKYTTNIKNKEEQISIRDKYEMLDINS